MSGRTYTQAGSVAEAVAAMAAGARPVAGGTDLVVGARHGKSPLPQAMVGIHRIPGLDSIEVDPNGAIRIGALVSHAAILDSPLLAEQAPGLLDASAIVGSHATRANGTLGGNVMNASPAMDTGAPLLCLGAQAVLTGSSGTRRLGLDELWISPGRTAASADELLEAIELPAPSGAGARGSAYVRLQYRRQMEIAVVGAAAVVRLSADGGRVADAAVAITAVTPVIVRVSAAEACLVGADLSGGGEELEAALQAAGRAAAWAATPISDVRASLGYRTQMVAVMTRRAAAAAIARARGQQVRVPASDWSVVR